MATPESGALLTTTDTTEPVTTSTRLWTQAGFVAAAIAVLISVFTGDDGILSSIIFIALTIGLAYVAYRYLVMGKVPADLGLSYVACGMWPLLVSFTIISIVWGIAIMFTSDRIVRAWNPLWYRNLNSAGSNLNGHGDLLLNDIPMQRRALANFYHAIHRYAIKQHHHHHRHTSSLPHAVSRFYAKIPSVMSTALHSKPLNAFRIHETDKFPPLKFADGTNASPLIAALLRSISKIPYTLLILAGFIYVVGTAYALQGLVFVFTLRPLKRNGATVVSVVACSRAIIIGFTALAFVLKNMSNLIVFILFVIYALFELALCTLISLRAYSNEHAVLEPERKPVLIEPVILQIAFSFVPWIGVFIFFKNAMRVLANIVDQIVLPRDGISAIMKWFIVVPIAFLPQLVVMPYAVYLAGKRYNDAVSLL